MAKFRLTNFYRCLQESNFPICVDFLESLRFLLLKTAYQFPYHFHLKKQTKTKQLDKLVVQRFYFGLEQRKYIFHDNFSNWNTRNGLFMHFI